MYGLAVRQQAPAFLARCTASGLPYVAVLVSVRRLAVGQYVNSIEFLRHRGLSWRWHFWMSTINLGTYFCAPYFINGRREYLTLMNPVRWLTSLGQYLQFTSKRSSEFQEMSATTGALLGYDTSLNASNPPLLTFIPQLRHNNLDISPILSVPPVFYSTFNCVPIACVFF